MNDSARSAHHSLENQVVGDREHQQLRHQILEVIKNRAPGITGNIGDCFSGFSGSIEDSKGTLSIADLLI